MSVTLNVTAFTALIALPPIPTTLRQVRVDTAGGCTTELVRIATPIPARSIRLETNCPAKDIPRCHPSRQRRLFLCIGNMPSFVRREVDGIGIDNRA